MKKIIIILFAVISLGLNAQKKYDVAAFLYPAYAADDPRLRPFWPHGMGEWETVANMQERNPGMPGTENRYGGISMRPTLMLWLWR